MNFGAAGARDSQPVHGQANDAGDGGDRAAEETEKPEEQQRYVGVRGARANVRQRKLQNPTDSEKREAHRECPPHTWQYITRQLTSALRGAAEQNSDSVVKIADGVIEIDDAFGFKADVGALDVEAQIV